LGSAFVEIRFVEKGVKKCIVFSGDLGNKNDIVLPSPQKAIEADALYIESTYGDRNHKNIDDSVDEFKDIVLKRENTRNFMYIKVNAQER